MTIIENLTIQQQTLRQFRATFPTPFVSTFNFTPMPSKPRKIKRASKAPHRFSVKRTKRLQQIANLQTD